jgi:hypothetical protein|tara:strand:- start:153 stop:848 length:696 start_codon:yes stop_codon:yes gene_type:complete
MSITRLQQARQMYALGQRVGGIMGSNAGSMLVTPTRDGSRPGYYGPDAGHENDPGHGSNAPGGGTGGNDRPNPHQGMKTPTVDLSHFGDPDPEVNVPTANRKDTITSFRNNYAAQRAAMGLLNFLPGAQIYNIGKTAFETNKARNLLGLGLTTVAPDLPDRDNGNNNEGIMNLYTSNMSNNLNEVEDIDDEQEIIPFINRFKLSADSTQAKGVERLIQDQAIANMISRLYT